jgi:hypothetical protein
MKTPALGRIEQFVEKLKGEHLIHIDPHMVARVKQLLQETFGEASAPGPDAAEPGSDTPGQGGRPEQPAAKVSGPKPKAAGKNPAKPDPDAA